MRKEILFSIFLMAFSFFTHAQITLNQADMPTIGDVQVTINASVTPGISVGSPGANQTWDFSDLLALDTSVSSFVSPAGTPGESTFPTATLAIESGGDYTYAEVTSSAAFLLGISADTSGMGDYFSLALDPVDKFFEFPTTYGTSYMSERGITITSEGSGLGFDSIRIINRALKDVVFDGYGTVITPIGTFDGLREEVITTNFDTTQVYFLGMWQTILTDMSIDTSYNWYSQESKGPLVSISIFDGAVADVSYQDVNPVFNVPVAAFSYVDLGQGNVEFTDESSNLPTSWLWDFGDGNTSTSQNPSHTYAAAGMYDVCLTASNSAGSDMICQTLEITISVVPVAAFSYDDLGQGAVDFTDESSNLPTTWFWDFGDGNTSFVQNPSHTYAASGMYEVCLTAGNNGGTDMICQTLDIEVVVAPVAAFTYLDPVWGLVEFMDQSTNQPTSWMWDFDDGETSIEQNPVHTFPATGMYNVCLTATNIAGSDTECQILDIIVSSINVLVEGMKVELFPNPATEWLSLILDSDEIQPLELVLYNGLGQPMMKRNINSAGQHVFDINNLAGGAYYFVLRSEKGQLIANGNFIKANGN